MTILFLDGLGKYKTIAEMAAAAGTILSQGGSISPTGGRFGGACVTGSDGATGSTALMATLSPAKAQGSTVFIGASLKFTSVNVVSGDFTIARFLGSGGSDLGRLRCYLSAATTRLYVTSATSNTVSAGDAPIGSAGMIHLNQWHRLEIKFTVGTTSTDGAIVVHLDGVEIINVTGINTRVSTQTLSKITLGSLVSSANSVFIDDIIIWDDQGTLNNSWLGDVRIDELLPTSNGAAQDWTPNTGNAWDAVNDTPASADDDTTYIASTTPAQRSRFATNSAVAAAATINAVRVCSRAKKSDATNAKTFKNYIHSGATDGDAATAVDPGNTAYKVVLGDVREVDPNTAAAWTVANANAAEIGVVEVT